MINRVEEAFDISIQYPVHSSAGHRHAQCIECIVPAATRPEAIAEAEKVLLVDARQNPQHRCWTILASGAWLFQTSGCILDEATTNQLISLAVQTLLTSLTGGGYLRIRIKR